jgi:hypothetical protein
MGNGMAVADRRSDVVVTLLSKCGTGEREISSDRTPTTFPGT